MFILLLMSDQLLSTALNRELCLMAQHYQLWSTFWLKTISSPDQCPTSICFLPTYVWIASARVSLLGTKVSATNRSHNLREWSLSQDWQRALPAQHEWYRRDADHSPLQPHLWRCVWLAICPCLCVGQKGSVFEDLLEFIQQRHLYGPAIQHLLRRVPSGPGSLEIGGYLYCAVFRFEAFHFDYFGVDDQSKRSMFWCFEYR